VLLALVELDPKNPAIKPLVRTIMDGAPRDPVLGHPRELLLAARADHVREGGRGRRASVTVALAGKDLLTGPLAGKQKLRVVTQPLPAQPS